MNLSIRFLFSFQIIVLCGNARFTSAICSGRIIRFMGLKCGFCRFGSIHGKRVSLCVTHLANTMFIVSLLSVDVDESFLYDLMRLSIKSLIDKPCRTFNFLLIRLNKFNRFFAFINHIFAY